MASAEFRASQVEGRYAPRVRPINELVDRLRDPEGRGWMPYVAPCHGGIDAQVLSVLRDPGPKTQDGPGSGFLCIENDDPTAELQGRDAEGSWRILARRHPEVNADGRFVVVSTYHPSPQALRTPDPSVRAARIQHRIEAYRQVADALERKPGTP